MHAWSRLTVIALLLFAAAAAARADIEINDRYERGEKIVAKVTPTGIPENALMRGMVTVTGKASAWQPDAAIPHHAIWADDGEHTITAAGTWVLTDTGELGGKLIDFGYYQYAKTFSVGAAPSPPPTPPAPDGNPYRPAPAFQAAVQPVKAFSLSLDDSRKLAEMYATVASQARAGAFKSLGEVRATLVQLGTPMGLKAKYAGLAKAVDAYFSSTLGLEDPVPADRVGDALETIAWAVWRAK